MFQSKRSSLEVYQNLHSLNLHAEWLTRSVAHSEVALSVTDDHKIFYTAFDLKMLPISIERVYRYPCRLNYFARHAFPSELVFYFVLSVFVNLIRLVHLKIIYFVANFNSWPI